MRAAQFSLAQSLGVLKRAFAAEICTTIYSPGLRPNFCRHSEPDEDMKVW